MMSLQVDRIKQNKIGWNSDYVNPNSQAYRVLEDESVYAVSTYDFVKFVLPIWDLTYFDTGTGKLLKLLYTFHENTTFSLSTPVDGKLKLSVFCLSVLLRSKIK